MPLILELTNSCAFSEKLPNVYLSSGNLPEITVGFLIMAPDSVLAYCVVALYPFGTTTDSPLTP